MKTKETNPTWTVYMKNGKLKATIDNSKIPKREIIGYGAYKKATMAIEYCVAMGFGNSYHTDHSPMRPWQRGEILYLLASGKTPLYVAEQTNRSIDWVMIVGGITGSARTELIEWYHNYKEDQKDVDKENRRGAEQRNVLSSGRRSGKLQTNGKKKTGVRISGTSNRTTNSRYNSGNTKTAVSNSSRKRRQYTPRPSDRNNNGVSTGKQRIVDKLRQSKDYVGD
jgi:hypothetical protein